MDRATAILDRAAGGCLERIGGHRQICPHDIVVLRRVAQLFILPLVVVPALLSFFYGAALALPIGMAVVVAFFLISAVCAIGVTRLSADARKGAQASAETGLVSAEFCPGLLLTMDASGSVQAAHGRDRDLYLSYLREPLSRPFVEQVHVSDRIAFARALDRLRQGENTATVDLRIDRPMLARDQAQFMNVRMDMTARRDAAGSVYGVFGQLLDISGELRIRAEAAAMASEAEKANDAKSRFLAAVSHELRTPLNAILGFSDILIGEYFGKLANDRQREYVQLVRQSGGHLLSVVNAMLDMSKIEAGRYELMVEPFAVAETVKECENMLALQARDKGITLTSRLNRDLGEVVADQRALRQALINLVGNAIKFTEKGGAVTIDAAIDGADLKISVSDTGIGIDPDKIALLGQPFVQIHSDHSRAYEGSGLGLSLVKGLIALHGGTFAMASRPGEGTVVTLTIPVDGSGVCAADDNEGQGNTVEFPPRLKAVLQPADMRKQKESAHDDAQAKIA
ncbi:MAG: sensor histidine kinase [Allorhizobium sp.]